MLGLGFCPWASLVAESGSYSLVVESGSYSLVVVHGLLTAVSSLVADHEHMGSVVVEHRLSSSSAQGSFPCGMWDLPGSGIEPISPTLQGRFLTSRPTREAQIHGLFTEDIHLVLGLNEA